MVLRLPCGGGITLGSFHSQELESVFLAMPGLKALYPSTPQDAVNAVLAASEDRNPVLIFEHKGLYRRGKHPVAWDPNYREAWSPRRMRSGDYATFVTYGEMAHLAADVCDYLATEYEASFDLFDLRALSPLRLGDIEASLARTGRLVVPHEGTPHPGHGRRVGGAAGGESLVPPEGPPAAHRLARSSRAVRARVGSRLPPHQGESDRKDYGMDGN